MTLLETPALNESPVGNKTPNGEGSVVLVAVSQLRTTYSRLRLGNQPITLDDLRPLPLRAVPAEGNAFEIIDGFKRFASWQSEGWQQIPVIVESPGSVADHKRRLLLANAPQRTLSPLDEGLVARSLLEDDGLTVSGVAKLLGHKKKWVTQRISFTQSLSVQAQHWLSTKRIGPTLAHLLTSLPHDDQDQLLACFSRHRVSGQHQGTIVQAYRVADQIDRGRLLLAPMSVLPTATSPTLSPSCSAQEIRLKNVSQALADLESFRIPPDMSAAEQRRLTALAKTVVGHMKQALSVLEGLFNVPNSASKDPASTEPHVNIPFHQKEKNHDRNCAPAPANAGEKSRSGCSTRDLEPGTQPHRQTTRQSCGPVTETDRDSTRGGGQDSAKCQDIPGQAYPLSGSLGRKGCQRPNRNQDSAGTQGTGLPRRANDPRCGGEPLAGAPALAEKAKHQASL